MGEMTAEYVFVAEFPDEVEAYKPAIESKNGEEGEPSVLAVGCWPEAYEAFAKLGIRTNNTIPYLPESSHERAFFTAADFAWGWYKGLEGCLCYEGQSLPESSVYNISQVFSHIFLNMELIKNIIASERPESLFVVAAPPVVIDSVLIGSQERYMAILAESVARQISVDVVAVPCSEGSPSVEEPCKNGSTQMPIQLIKRVINVLFPDPRSFFFHLAKKLPFFEALLHRRVLARYRVRLRRLVFWEGLSMRCRLYEALRRDRRYGVIGLTSSRPVSPLGEGLLPTLWTGDFVTEEIESRIQRARESLLRAWEALSSDAAFTSRFRYEGIDFWPAVRPRLEFFFTRHFPACIRQYECVREFVRRFDPHLLIVGQIPGEYMAWVHKAFQDSGKPTLVMPEGYDIGGMGIVRNRDKLLHGLKSTVWPLYASKLAARGLCTKQWYEENGITPDRIEVTGVPDWGNGASISQAVRRQICRLIGLDPDKCVVVYTASISERTGVRAYSDETIYEILQATRDVIEELARIPNYGLVVKLHPGTRYSKLFRQIALPFPEIKILDAEIDFRKLVSICDVLITSSGSSTAVEALLHDKDVIIYNPVGRENVNTPLCMEVDDPDTNYVVHVSERRNLAPTVKRLRTDEVLRRKLAKKRLSVDPLLIHNRDGKSLERVMGLMDEMLAEK